ncbi:MAG: sulfite exporter TauE/SafE family protein [Actinomycetes bacterium]
MSEYLLVALAGFAACMVDGALGMGFGPTSSTILLGTGLPPVAVSATVNLAKVATGVVGGFSHWRFGNVDRRLAIRLALPGAAGAIVGVVVLRNVDAATLKPLLAVVLLLVALRMLVRFSRTDPAAASERAPGGYAPRAVGAAGFAGGITNGLIGAWGPVVTPVLLHQGIPARFTVGSVNAAEVAVAIVSVGSLASTIRSGGIDVGVLVAMLVGGVLAAPLAAALVRRLPKQGLGVAVASMLLVTNVRELVAWGDLGPTRWLAYAGVLVVVLWAWARPHRRRCTARVETVLAGPHRS